MNSIFLNLATKAHKTLLYAQIAAMIREFSNIVNRKYGLRGSRSNSRVTRRVFYLDALHFGKIGTKGT